MRDRQAGFSLVELIAVLTLVGVLSVVLFSRITGVGASRVQASRDDVIAALSFAQQLSMSRNNIQVVISANNIDVTENGTSIQVDSSFYPLILPSGISLSAIPSSFSYDKLGRTSAGSIQVQSSDGAFSVNVTVEATGYAH